MFAVAKALGFHLAYDHRPNIDEWTLHKGHGPTYAQHVGSRASICAFLAGYAAMNVEMASVLNDLDTAHRRSVNDARQRLGAP